MKKTKQKKIYCPWCSKNINISRSNRLGPHVTPGNQKCVGVGQPIHTAKFLNKNKEKNARVQTISKDSSV